MESSAAEPGPLTATVGPGSPGHTTGGVIHTQLIPPGEILAEVERICAHPLLYKSTVLRQFLRFTVAETLAGRGAALKEYSVALSAFGRGPDFDPRFSSVVRTQARNLRARLADYYREFPDAIRITYVPGAYAPDFSRGAAPGLQAPVTPARRSSPKPEWQRGCTTARALWRSGHGAKIEQAIAILTGIATGAPQYGPAFAGLALCHGLSQEALFDPHSPARTDAKALALEALALAPECSEAWTALGVTKLLFEWDFEAGRECLEAAAQRDPADGLPVAMLAAVYHLRNAAFATASELADRALALSPGDALVGVCAARVAFCQRNYVAAQRQLDALGEKSPHCFLAAMLRPWVATVTGRHDQALEAAARMPAGADWMRAVLLFRSGKPEDILRLLAEHEKGRPDDNVSDLFRVIAFADLGDRDNATATLTRAVRRHSLYAICRDCDPRYDTLRALTQGTA